jgi:hypothetical protein
MNIKFLFENERLIKSFWKLTLLEPCLFTSYWRIVFSNGKYGWYLDG